MRKHLFLCGFVLFSLLFAAILPAFGESARGLVEEGNEAFGRGEYDTSLKKYQKAGGLVPDSAVVQFNRGAALYRKERYDEAFDAFEQAASQAMTDGDRELETKSRYNMGNSAFRRAERLSLEDPRRGLEEFKRSSGFFQDAVQGSPGFAEAAQNLEISRRAVKQLEELIQQQEQQARDQAQQKQEIADELQKLQQEQQQAAQQSGEMARKQEEAGSGGDAAQQAERQQAITEQTRETGEKLEDLNTGKESQLSNEMAREHVKRALDKQEAAEKELRQNNPAAAQQEQEEAAQELEKAIQQLQQEQDIDKENKGAEWQPEESREQAGQQKQQAGAEQEGRQDPPESLDESAPDAGEQQEETPGAAAAPGSESPEEIINEELRNRKHRALGGGTGYRPVEKDW